MRSPYGTYSAWLKQFPSGLRFDNLTTEHVSPARPLRQQVSPIRIPLRFDRLQWVVIILSECNASDYAIARLFIHHFEKIIKQNPTRHYLNRLGFFPWFSAFSNLSVTSPTSQLILQPFRRFTYITAHYPTLLLLHLRHGSFSNPSFASRTPQVLYLIHMASRPWPS